jgi:SAM-dependent methyltransferase
VDAFDRRYGTDTAGILPFWRIPPDLSGRRFAVRYQPSDELWLTEPLRALKEDWGYFTFVDVGAGKGKAIIVAASFGFKSLIGIEFVPALAKIAKANLEKVCIKNAEVVCMDAAAYRFPQANLVVFFYNPFSDEMMRRVIANLREDAIGRVYVIYANAKHEGVLLESGFLDYVCSRPNVSLWRAKEKGEGLG